MRIFVFIFGVLAISLVCGCGGDDPNLTVRNSPPPPENRDAGVPAVVNVNDVDAGAPYQSMVKRENMTVIGSAALSMAKYLNGMHNRIHPIFSDQFIMSLEALPAGGAINNPKIFTMLEIIVRPDGSIAKMGVVRSSGILHFDEGAVRAVAGAAPFGPTPKEIQSPDGLFYMHWEFHRDPIYSCSTMNVRPFMLKAPPGTGDADAETLSL